MKENGKVMKKKAMEFISFRTEIFTKVSSKKVLNMETGSIIFQMVKLSLEFLIKTKW